MCNPSMYLLTCLSFGSVIWPVCVSKLLAVQKSSQYEEKTILVLITIFISKILCVWSTPVAEPRATSKLPFIKEMEKGRLLPFDIMTSQKRTVCTLEHILQHTLWFWLAVSFFLLPLPQPKQLSYLWWVITAESSEMTASYLWAHIHTCTFT